ncbi:MAG: UDP-N-acetylmuramoyl-tripeptide--D-alanyl-D-alanine ligase [Bacteroidales bacterium]
MEINELYSIYLDNPGIVIDSRKAREKSIFFGLPGEHENGGSYAARALEAGCAFAVVDSPAYCSSPRCILVDNSLQTLTSLAAFHRKMLNIPVIAITGSNGKTTTKELLASVLRTRYKVIATTGNLNNHIGVPLTILSIPTDTDIAVIEMGANHPGEIAALCEIAQPTHGLITMIGKAHLEGFGSFEGVIAAKSELYQYLNQPGKTVFVNADDSLLLKLLENFKGSLVKYGTSEMAGCRGRSEGAGPFLKFQLYDQNTAESGISISTQLFGDYNLSNALAAASAGLYFEIDLPAIASALTSYSPQNNRSQLLQTARNSLVLDYYNANPTSMEAALRNFTQMQQGKGMLILGDMLELGTYGPDEHEKINQLARISGAETVLLVGTIFGNTSPWPGRHTFPDSEGAARHLAQIQPAGYHILIKGSRGIQLEKTIPYL